MNEPHKTVVWLKIDVRPLLNTGEISGAIRETTNNVIYAFDGNEQECKAKLREILDKVQELCKSKPA